MEALARRSVSQVEASKHQVFDLAVSSGRPVRVVGTEVGEVVTREGASIRVYRTVSGRRVLHRFVDSCWGGFNDVVVVEGLDDDRLMDLLGSSADAMSIYKQLGVDPVQVLE